MAADNNHKNPIAQATGLYIRQLRLERGWDFEIAAKNSGISKAYFKSLEVASFTLHISKSYVLYNTFLLDAPANSEIPTLDGWMCLLSTITTLDGNSKKGSFKDYLKSIEDVAEKLSQSSPILKKLLHPFLSSKIFGCTNSKAIQEIIENTELVHHIENFVTRFDTLLFSGLQIQQNTEIQVSQVYDNTPSLYFDFVEETLDRLKSLPVKIHYSEINVWEKKNANRFKNIYVLVRDKYDPSNKEDFEEFQYSYLINRGFTKMQFHFLNNPDLINVKKEFLKSLIANTNKEKTGEMKVAFAEKVLFEGITASDIKELSKIFNPEHKEYDLISEKSTKKYVQYDVFWLYQIKDDVYVGFVAQEQSNTDGTSVSIEMGRNLTNGEIKDFLKLECVNNKIINKNQ